MHYSAFVLPFILTFHLISAAIDDSVDLGRQDTSVACTSPLATAPNYALVMGQTRTVTSGTAGCYLRFIRRDQDVPQIYEICLFSIDPNCDLNIKQLYWGSRVDQKPVGKVICECFNKWHEIQVSYNSACSGGFKVRGFEVDSVKNCTDLQ